MRRGQRRPTRQLTAVDPDNNAERPNTPPARTATPGGWGNHSGPLAEAASTLAQALDAAADAEGTVRIAQAQLDETLATAGRLSPAVSAAQRDRANAAETAQTRSVAVRTAERTLEDRAGALRAAQAAYAELAEHAGPANRVAATERVERANRARDAAAEALVLAQEAREEADHELTATEQHLEYVRGQPERESSQVIAAREQLTKAERDQHRADQQAATAQADYDRAKAIEAGADTGPGHTPLFASLDAFVDQYVLPNWRHPHDRTTYWCAEWWRHEEAVTRLETLWEAFEVARREPAPSLSTWLRDHFDHHLTALTHANGPFARCDAKQRVHEAGPVWPHEDPGPGVFDVDPDAAVQPRREQHTQGVAS